MSVELVTILVPTVPALAAGLALLDERLIPWLWLSCLPALIAVGLPALDWSPGFMWGGALWQVEGTAERTWLAFTALLWGCAGLFAGQSTRYDAHRKRFWLFWQLALAGNLLLVISQDALSFYVGFTVMSLAAYGLVVHYGRPDARRAGRLYLQLAITGEMLLLAVFAMRTAAAQGETAFAVWQDLPIDATTTGLLLVGFGLKIGIWPFHFWLPLAHPAAPSPASAVLSGAMIEAGILGLWRTLPSADPVLQDWAGGLMALGLASAFYGVLLGLVTLRAKAVLAFSSVSQMGYLLIILALVWRYPAQQTGLAILLAFFAAHHGLCKGALFLATGLPQIKPVHSFLLVLPALAIAGLPLSSGAAAKGELEHLLADSHFHYAAWLFPLASAGTALLLARALWLLRRENTSREPVPPALLIPWVPLCVAPLLLPWLGGFRSMLLDSFTWSGTWALLWPLAAGLLLGAVALYRGWRLPMPAGGWISPALGVSLQIKRLLLHPPVPHLARRPDWHWWRKQERQWNHFLNRHDIISTSLWLLCLVLFLGFIW